MPQPDPSASQASRTPEGRQLLEDLRARAQAGQVPSPQEVAAAQRAAQANLLALAAGLAPADEAGLQAYEEALLLCMDLAMLGLELARSHGPAYLPLPGVLP